MALDVIKYGSFSFPYNPTTTSFSSEMKIAKHQYPNVNGADLEFLGAEPIEIKCEGVFFSNSKSQFDKLYAVYKTGTVQSFSHPLFPDCKKCIMIRLDADVKAEDDVIHFSFTVVADRSSYVTATVKTTSSSSTSSSSNSSGATVKTYSFTTKKSHKGWTAITKHVNTLRKKKLGKKWKSSMKVSVATVKNWNTSLKKKTTIPKGSKIKYKL